MNTPEKEVEWLCSRTEEYCSAKNDISGVVEDLVNGGKLGQGFSSVDKLNEVDIGDDGLTH
jgi:hypothetical protein